MKWCIAFMKIMRSRTNSFQQGLLQTVDLGWVDGTIISIIKVRNIETNVSVLFVIVYYSPSEHRLIKRQLCHLSPRVKMAIMDSHYWEGFSQQFAFCRKSFIIYLI
jgi:hypothetical protein